MLLVCFGLSPGEEGCSSSETKQMKGSCKEQNSFFW
jgi:hypothetical protein